MRRISELRLPLLPLLSLPLPSSRPPSLVPWLLSLLFPLCLLVLCLNGEAGFPRTCTPLTGFRARCWGVHCQDSRG